MALTVTTLIDNSADADNRLLAEHGLSFFVEKDGRRILFDSGQSAAFLNNAEALEIDLQSLDAVVLSHGHYDHSGGFRALAAQVKGFQLISGHGFFAEKFGLSEGKRRFLGNDFDEQFLRQQGIPWRCVSQAVTEVFPGIFVVTRFPRVHDDEGINPRFTLYQAGAFRPDPFDDEVLLAIESSRGLVVLLGCSHPGMKNMLEAVHKHLKQPIYAVLGGTHLVEAADERLALSLEYLHRKGMSHIGLCHCTGQKALAHLDAANKHYVPTGSGSVLVVA